MWAIKYEYYKVLKLNQKKCSNDRVVLNIADVSYEGRTGGGGGLNIYFQATNKSKMWREFYHLVSETPVTQIVTLTKWGRGKWLLLVEAYQ